MKSDVYTFNGTEYCTKDELLSSNETAPLYRHYCPNDVCEDFFRENNVSQRAAIPGLNTETFLREHSSVTYYLSSTVLHNNDVICLATVECCVTFVFCLMFVENRMQHYRDEGEFVTGNSTEQGTKRDILAEISTSFTILLAIFFPSCTGQYHLISSLVRCFI